MLSYRHAFHSGNHADCLKHLTLCLLLGMLTQKDKPLSYLDTHAGAGAYDLRGEFASRNREYQGGVAKIMGNARLRELVPGYYAALAALNPDLPEGAAPRAYPGSPTLAAALCRECDRLLLNELHPADHKALEQRFRHDPRVAVHRRDAYEALGALLPPTPRRGLCLIDPSYEVQGEIHSLLKALKGALAKWQVGIFAIWYPVLARELDYSKNLTHAISRLGPELLQVEMRVGPQPEGHGMCGSGMLILNPPYQLKERLGEMMDALYPALASEGGAARLAVFNGA
ncbi:MAG: 23S rRNA (adenine(2030)-N(6))-methyltransferase RlmJ [Succinivibrionaceae bacterium]|nr:23S rRNA (adenine(2030)-N(6))-methyltransferase RlmJ [Succinivibrionaceae bacterium]